jgi:NTE family protein
VAARIGVALSGGGARGIAHIGVLKVLEELAVPVHMLAGTSMGGVVAAFYAAGRSAAEIENLATSLRLLDLLQRDRTNLGLLGHGKISDRLREALGGDLTFDQLKLPLAVIAVDLETGEEVAIREGPVVDALLATTAVPLIFSPVHWRGRWLVDGGVLNPCPFGVVREMGAERVLAIHTSLALTDPVEGGLPPGGRRAEAAIRTLLHRSGWASLIAVTERAFSITSARLVEQHLAEAPPDLMIDVRLRDISLFDLDCATFCLQAGEQAGREHEPELIALRDGPEPLTLGQRWRALFRPRDAG